MRVDVVSAEKDLYNSEALSVFAPGINGELGIFPGHMALISVLKPGEIRINTKDGEHSIYVAGGIIEVQPKMITIFSDTAVRAKDLDEEKALEAKQKAEELMENVSEDKDLALANAMLAESVAQLQIIRKRYK